MRCVCVCVCVCVCMCVCVCACTHTSLPGQWESKCIPERGVTYKQPYTMARKTWAARHRISPRTNLRLSNGGIKGSVLTTWNQWQVWKTKVKAGCLGHNIPVTQEGAEQRQGAGRGRGLTGCTWRDSLGLQLRTPGPSPKGIGSVPPPLSQDVSWIPGSEPGYPCLPVSKVLSVQILSLLEAWPKPISTFHCQLSLRKGFSFCLCGVPEFEVMPTDHRLCGSNKVRQSAGKLKQSRFNILACFCYLSNTC